MPDVDRSSIPMPASQTKTPCPKHWKVLASKLKATGLAQLCRFIGLSVHARLSTSLKKKQLVNLDMLPSCFLWALLDVLRNWSPQPGCCLLIWRSATAFSRGLCWGVKASGIFNYTLGYCQPSRIPLRLKASRDSTKGEPRRDVDRHSRQPTSWTMDNILNKKTNEDHGFSS